MKVTTKPASEKFAVSAGYSLGVDLKLETLSLQLGETEVKLDSAECEELLKILSGKECIKIVAYANKDEYSPHSMIACSSMDEKHGEVIIYSEDSLARF